MGNRKGRWFIVQICNYFPGQRPDAPQVGCNLSPKMRNIVFFSEQYCVAKQFATYWLESCSPSVLRKGPKKVSQLLNVFVPIAKCFCPNFTIYLSQLHNVFVPISTSICPNFTIYLSQLHNVFVPIAKCIRPNCQMHLSHLQNVFVPIAKWICLNCKIHLSQLQNVFVPIAKWICPNCKIYLSHLQIVFVPIAKCICPKLQNVFVPISKCICPNCKMMIFPLSGVCPGVLELHRQRKGSSRKLFLLGSKVHRQVARQKEDKTN